MPHLKRESVRRECLASLQRLGVERIDLYQMHWPDPLADIEEAWEEMARLADEGKVRYLGVCNYNVEQIERVCRIHPVASLQPPYSMLRRDVEKELLGYCAQHSIGVVAYSPMQRGLLTGKFSHERLAALAPDDHRRRMPEFQDPAFSASLELVEGLQKIADRAQPNCRSIGDSLGPAPARGHRRDCRRPPAEPDHGDRRGRRLEPEQEGYQRNREAPGPAGEKARRPIECRNQDKVRLNTN